MFRVQVTLDEVHKTAIDDNTLVSCTCTADPPERRIRLVRFRALSAPYAQAVASTENSLIRSLQSVTDEKSFLGFLETLSHDRTESVGTEIDNPSSPWGPEANGWENPTIERFLLAAVAWAAASARAPALQIAQNPWRRCADIIFAGKGYE